MEKMPLISVIVPLYNVEEYLERCIKSILDQTYTNMEIILVDDGSTDNSGSISDKYAGKDQRIMVIHKENGGLSDARNAGLDAMTGDYVAFVDSDDFVSPWYLENLYKAACIGQTGISVSWFTIYHEGNDIRESHRVEKNEISVLDKKEYFRRMLYQDRAEVSAWGKLYKSSFFDNVRYPKGKLYEDVAVIYKLIDKVERVAVIPTEDYYYQQRQNSIMHTCFTARKMDVIPHMRGFVSYIFRSFPELWKAAICRYFSALCNTAFIFKDKKHEKQRRFIWGEIKKYRRIVLSDPAARKKAKLGALLSFAGYGTMRRIYMKINEK